MRPYPRDRLEPGGEPRQHETHDKYRCGRTAHGELLEHSLRAKGLQLSADMYLDEISATVSDAMGFATWVAKFCNRTFTQIFC